jgi:hypothetical protein
MLILWHGLADPHISPINTLSSHKALQAKMGELDGRRLRAALPAAGCRPLRQWAGPSNLDLLTATMAWVEGGTAPDAIMTRSASQASSVDAPGFGGKPPEGAPKGGMPPLSKSDSSSVQFIRTPP